MSIEVGHGLTALGDDRWPLALGAGARHRLVVPVRIGGITGSREITLLAALGGYSDRITRTLRVAPLGFPVEITRGGVVEADGLFSHTIEIPADVVAPSVESEIVLYPTPLASLTGALEALLQEPHGCFEQTSSTTYPLIMAQQYFMSHPGVDPALIERARGLLDNGYQRLIGFECKQKGYEWFGEDPGHEALSAYGLLEFSDMAQVRQVDSAMLERTRAWLLGTRDGEGNFRRERRALHTWVAEGEVTEAKVTVTNLEDAIIPTPVAIIGVPGGLEVRHDQLKELVKAGRIAAYEVIGREVVLYWRSLAPGQKVELPISFVAAVPGKYTGPASRAYLYYTGEHKHWVEPMAVEIAPAS